MPSRQAVVLVSPLVATLAVGFWLWLVVLPATAAILCPKECWCETGGYRVFCNESLNDIPLIFDIDVRILWLEYSKIRSLKKDIFISKGLPELEEFTADKCEIRSIEVGAFNGLTKLINLSMPYNEISEITTGTFDNMESLEKLNLTDNKIQHLQFDIFRGLANLKHINLKSNKLQYVNPDAFVGLPNLEYLDLANNPDLHIPTDRHFINSHSLLELCIRECKVTSVSVKTFAKVTAMELLDLSYNKLRSVDINILKALPKLSTLYLDGNPLQCDCQLQEVWRWCQEHNIQTVSGETAPECDTPSEVQGMWWGVLEKGQCLEDTMDCYEAFKSIRYSYTPTKATYNDTGTDIYTKTDNSKDMDRNSNVYNYDLLLCLVLLCAALFIFGTTGNVILLIIITCNKEMRTVPNMYILNLAISDLFGLTLVFSLGFQIPIYFTLMHSDYIIILFSYWSRLSVGLSAYSVAVLSIQRYRVTVNPLRVRVSSQPIWHATAAPVSGVWIVAALFALPSGFSLHLCSVVPDEICIIQQQRVAVFQLLVSCVLPLCVIAVSYIMTDRHLLKSARPYHVFWMFFFWTDRSMTWKNWYLKSLYGFIFSMYLLLISPCLNPVALFCTSLAFRRQFKRYLTFPEEALSFIMHI